ncbi:MAG TPA: LON peptidase substrate-binding domain-containing protein, partial [bacterium]|nr:LON peptidase substrate-binding domain-containing protein [bacterium]
MSTSVMPLLPVRDIVVFPYMILPLFVGRDNSIKAVEEALEGNRLVFLSAQKNMLDEAPTPDQIYETGTVAMIVRMKKLPDGRAKVLIQGMHKAVIKSFEQTDPFFKVKVENIEEKELDVSNPEISALMRNIREQIEKIVAMGKLLSPDILVVMDEIKDGSKIADIIAANIGLNAQDAQQILEQTDPLKKLYKVNEHLLKEAEIISLQNKINNMAKDEMTRAQKEYFLKEQMKAIKSELGDNDGKNEDMSDIRRKLTEIKMPEEVKIEAFKQLDRLERMHPDASESAVLRTYLEWITETPWMINSEDNMDLEHAKKILDEDHYDLEEIKERIIEHLAVSKLNKKIKGPILCFVGAPGVGKTSLGKSIARALGRKFVRIS